MAETDTDKYISKVELADGQYKIKDTEARGEISAVAYRVDTAEANIQINSDAIDDIKKEIKGGVHYIGKSSTEITDGGTETPTIPGWSGPLSAGDMAIYGGDAQSKNADEFIWSGEMWNRLGSTNGLGALAFKDSASASYTPAGGVSIEQYSGTTAQISATFTPGDVTVTGGGLTLDAVTGLTGTISIDPVTPTATLCCDQKTVTPVFQGDTTQVSARFDGSSVTPGVNYTGQQTTVTVGGTISSTATAPSISVQQNSDVAGNAFVEDEVLKFSFNTMLTSVAATATAPTVTSTPTLTGTCVPSATVTVDAITPAGDVVVSPVTPQGHVEQFTITPTGSVSVQQITHTGSVTVQDFTPTGSVGDIGVSISGSVTGSVAIPAHSHDASFDGEDATITAE